MKRIYLILFILFLGLSTTVSSQETAMLLTGTWTFDYQESLQIMDTASKMHLDSVSPIRKQRIESSYIGRQVTFNTDGSYSQILSDGHIANGTWALSADNQYVSIADSNGNSYTQKIEVLSATQLVLKPVLSANTRMLISIWSFVKS